VFSTTETLLIAATCIIIGAIIGTFISSRLSSDSRKNRDLSGELTEAKNHLHQYQKQVEEHFIETARLVDNLTQNYREVHNHLAQGASELLDDIEEEKTLKKLPGDETRAEKDIEAIAAPPLDYAPKDPNARGVLDESFGLNKAASSK